jgi:hypothetical protein
MGLVTLLLLLVGQPTPNTTSVNPGSGTVHPDSGGIPTCPPAPWPNIGCAPHK